MSRPRKQITTIKNLEELALFATDLVTELSSLKRDTATVLALSGDLGAGKTALTKAIATVLGVGDSVTSPTFVIEKIYALAERATARTGFSHLIHIDAYRLVSANELLTLGFKDILAAPGNLIVVEWPERVGEIVPSDAVRLQLTFIDDKTRTIERV